MEKRTCSLAGSEVVQGRKAAGSSALSQASQMALEGTYVAADIHWKQLLKKESSVLDRAPPPRAGRTKGEKDRVGSLTSLYNPGAYAYEERPAPSECGGSRLSTVSSLTALEARTRIAELELQLEQERASRLELDVEYLRAQNERRRIQRRDRGPSAMQVDAQKERGQ